LKVWPLAVRLACGSWVCSVAVPVFLMVNLTWSSPPLEI